MVGIAVVGEVEGASDPVGARVGVVGCDVGDKLGDALGFALGDALGDALGS